MKSGWTSGVQELSVLQKPITPWLAFIHFANDDERNKFIRSANMLKKELRGRENQNNEINGY